MYMLPILDILLLVLAVLIVIGGYRKGFIWQAMHWIGWIVSLVVAFSFAGELARIMHEWIPFTWTPEGDASFWWELLQPESMLYLFVAFLFLLFISKFVIALIASILNAIAKFPGLNLLNRLLGSLLGVIQALLICFIIVHVLLWLPWDTGQRLLMQSEIGLSLLAFSPFYPY